MIARSTFENMRHVKIQTRESRDEDEGHKAVSIGFTAVRMQSLDDKCSDGRAGLSFWDVVLEKDVEGHLDGKKI